MRMDEHMSRFSRQCDGLSMTFQRLEARISNTEGTPTNARVSSKDTQQAVAYGHGSRVTTVESESVVDDWVIVYGVEISDLAGGEKFAWSDRC